MDPLSIAASIVALATVSKSVIDSGRKYVRNVREAPVVLSRFCDELEALTILFNSFLVLQSTTQDINSYRPGALTKILRSAPLLKDLESQLRNIETKIKDTSSQNTRRRLIFPLKNQQVLEGLRVVDRIRSILDTALLVDDRFTTHSVYTEVLKFRAAYETSQARMLTGNSRREALLEDILITLRDESSNAKLAPTSLMAGYQRTRNLDYLRTQARRFSSSITTKRQLEFLFGSLSMWSKSRVESVEADRTSCKKKHSRLTMVFYPSPMFWRALIRFQIDWDTSFNFLMAPMFSLQFLDIVQDHHPVIRASRQGNVGALEDTFSQGSISPLCSTTAGWTPLHFAAAHGQTDACRFLIAEGAPLNATGICGIMPLHLAAHFGHLEVFRVLLEAGSDPDDYHDHGMNAVIEILSNENMSKSPDLAEFLKWLLCGQERFLLDVSARDNNSQRTILRDLAYPPGWTSSSPQALHSDQIEAIKSLLLQGVKGDELDIYGTSVLHKACRDSRLDLVKLLLTGNCDINVRDSAGYSPLHRAIEAKSFQIVSTLVTHRSDVNALADFIYHRHERIRRHQRRERHTPLSLAAGIDRVDMVDLLIQYGAGCSDANVANAFCVAVRRRSQETVQYFIGNNLHQLELSGIVAGIVSDTLLLEKLYQVGAPLDDPDEYGDTALAIAAGMNNQDAVHKLIELGADLDKLSHGLTPLGYAARWGHGNTVDILLASGAQADLTGDGLSTPWQIASKKGFHTIADNIARCVVAKHNTGPIDTLPEALVEEKTDAAEEIDEAVAPEESNVHARTNLENSDVKIVERQIGDGLISTSKQIGKRSCITLAIVSRQWALAEELIEAGAELNVCFADRPFETAIRYGTVSLVEVMIRHGADVNIRDADGLTLLNLLVIEYQREHKFGGARCRKVLDKLRLLLSAGADVDAINDDGQSALGEAASNGLFELVVSLVEAGANLNIPSLAYGWAGRIYLPPIALAAFNGHAKVVRFLFDSGAEWRSLQKGPAISYAHRWLMQSWFPDNAEPPTKPVHFVEPPGVSSTCCFDKNKIQSSDQSRSGNTYPRVREREYQASLGYKSRRVFAAIVNIFEYLSQWFQKFYDQLHSIRIEAVAFICVSLLILIRETFRNHSIPILATAKVFAFTMLVAILMASKMN